MRFPRRTNYCILLVLVFVTVAFRYPIGIEHEMGSDTTFVHTMANSIVQESYAKWILHPSSYFGLYALSYPSAIPFILASGNEATGISVEGMMLLTGILFAIAGTICVYLAAKLIRDDDLFAHLMALLFTIAPFFVKDTRWVASSRGYVVALVPFLYLLLFKHIRTKNLRYLVLSLAVFIVLASTHRMGILSILILIAYVFAIPLHLITQRLRFSLIKFEKPVRVAIVLTALLAFLSVFYIQFHFPGISGANVFEEYATGAFFNGASFQILLLNMAVSFVGRVGLLLPLAVLGLMAYVWKRPKESYDIFLLLTILLFLPMLSLRNYVVEFAIPLFLFLTMMGVIRLAWTLRRRRQLAIAVVATLIISSVAFSWVMKDYWRNTYPTDDEIPDGVYDSALYIRTMNWGTVATSNGLSGGRIAAISEMPNLPLGGASTHFYSTQQLIWDFVDPEHVRVRLLDLTTLSMNTDEIYVPVGIQNAEADWEAIMMYRAPMIDNARMDRYNVHFIVSENDLFPYYTSYGSTRASCLFGSDAFCVNEGMFLPKERYVTFTNSMVTIWLAKGGPPHG